MKIYFFRTPKPRKYVHKNIYYDPEKEAREERQERVRKELGQYEDGESYSPSIKRGSFRRYRYDEPNQTSEMHRARRASNIRLIIIIVALLAIAVALYLSSGAFLAL